MGRRQCKRRARGWPDSRLWGGRARAERTSNMLRMFVTLDVSKLSGWLNAFAFCRVERRECDVGRGATREARGRWLCDGDASGVRWRARLKAVEAGHARSAP